MLTGNTAVILIDCWDSTDPEETDIRTILFENIISRVSELPNLKLVIHSSYDREIHKPNEKIENHSWPCQTEQLYHIHELKNYSENIENFILMGMHWDRCLKNRDLGWKSLKTNFPDKKIYVIENCILSLNNQTKKSFWVNLKNDDRCSNIINDVYQIIA